MSELTYKKIIDVEQVETLNDAATVFINDNGAMKQVGADKFGFVKSVNGVVPDENGDIKSDRVAAVQLRDMSSMGMGLKCNKTAAEISSYVGQINAVEQFELVDMGAWPQTPIYYATHVSIEGIYDADGTTLLGKKTTIYFGDLYAPVIVNTANNTITLDPDWVNPNTNEPHQMLVTNADGETEWQNRTHYSEISIIDIIPQQDVAMTKHPTEDCYWNSSFALFEGINFIANEVYTVYFDGNEYSCVPFKIGAFTYLGDASMWGESNQVYDEPFMIRMSGTTGSICVKNEGTYSLRITGPYEVYHGISGDYTGIYRNDIGALNTKKDSAGNGGKNSFGIIGTAMGEGSFAHGMSSMAMSKYSAAMNGSIAGAEYQFTCGYNNKVDMAGKYLHIVGNGKNGRSNAYTLDWSGNGWFAGTVEGTAMILKSSTEGSTKRFKITVDDSGLISATEIQA